MQHLVIIILFYKVEAIPAFIYILGNYSASIGKTFNYNVLGDILYLK